MDIDPGSEAIGQLRAEVRLGNQRIGEILSAVQGISDKLPPLESRIEVLETAKRNGNILLVGGTVGGTAAGAGIAAFWKTILISMGFAR